MNSEYKAFWITFTILIALSVISFVGLATLVSDLYKILGG